MSQSDKLDGERRERVEAPAAAVVADERCRVYERKVLDFRAFYKLVQQ